MHLSYYEKPYVDMANKEIFGNIKELISDYFSTKPVFDNAVSMYYYDEYMTDTYILSTAPATIYVEIDAPDNFKPGPKGEKYAFNHDKLKVPSLYLTLKTIKQNIYDLFINNFNSDCTIWKSRYGVMLSTFLEDEEGNRVFYKYQIIPCLSYTNKNNVKGVMYYNDYNSDICIDYPKLSLINYKIKQKQTDGLYAEYVKCIKTLYMSQSKEEELPAEIYETMLYNVPNEMFIDENYSNINAVITYLKNKPLREYKSIDEQDAVLASPYRLMSAVYVNHVLKLLTRYINNK